MPILADYDEQTVSAFTAGAARVRVRPIEERTAAAAAACPVASTGLGDGGKPAVPIPAVLEQYALSICSGDFNQWTRKVAALYNNTPAGVPGNDDCGQTSTWFVFASLGFYPVNAVTGVYVLGSPLVNRAAIHNPAAKTTFHIEAENNSAENMYVQSVRLNGKLLSRSWITHDEILAGGDLQFRMGARPNKEWGSAPADRPPSGLLPGKRA